MMPSLFANALIVDIENPKESTNSLLELVRLPELVSEFSKVTGSEANTHKKVVSFFSMSDEHAETEI